MYSGKIEKYLTCRTSDSHRRTYIRDVRKLTACSSAWKAKLKKISWCILKKSDRSQRGFGDSTASND
jgi:hypothetical protein